ncbi:MAG: DUF2336 domain-containing protein [Rhodospirillales bacterium]|nr:DUF2336 domain-containing protein [Rhodospirillales bacterium]
MTISAESLLTHHDEATRLAIAQRVGQRLGDDAVTEADRQAAEQLVAALAQDAIDRVREALAVSVRNAEHLPRPVALRIAHDIDSVACPFLEFTKVFSESDWQQLVLTLSRSSLVAVARRTPMTEQLAASLATVGDADVATTLARNKAAPMTPPVCLPLLERFEPFSDVLEVLAERDDLVEEVALRLTTMVSEAARAKMRRLYDMPEQTALLGAEAEATSLVALVRKTQPDRLEALARSMRKLGKLTDFFLLRAARERLSGFLAAAIAERTGRPVEAVARILLRGSSMEVAALLREAGVNQAIYEEFWLALSATRLSAFHHQWSTKVH